MLPRSPPTSRPGRVFLCATRAPHSIHWITRKRSTAKRPAFLRACCRLSIPTCLAGRIAASWCRTITSVASIPVGAFSEQPSSRTGRPSGRGASVATANASRSTSTRSRHSPLKSKTHYDQRHWTSRVSKDSHSADSIRWVTERVLFTRELNRALLARQFLLERSRHSLPSTLERVAGLQAQYAPSGYIWLWSRLEDLRRPALTKALEQKRAIQASLMRVTIHMVAARDYV